MNLHLRRLSKLRETDFGLISQLLFEAPEVTLGTYGRLPSRADVDAVFAEVPQGCSPENCLVFGVFHSDRPIGFVKVLRSWPTPDAAVIALLLIRRSHRRTHCGCDTVQRLSTRARHWPGISTWKLSVLESNPGALAFWRHCGFGEGKCGLMVPGLAGPVTNMERRVKARVECRPRAVTLSSPFEVA